MTHAAQPRTRVAPRRSRSAASTVVLLVAALVLGGCLSRRIFVTSEPPGARVWLNDVEIGRTPVATEFTYFGTYSVRLEREGFETLETPREAVAPWYEYPIIDLLAIAAPWNIETKLDWHFELEPKDGPADRGDVLERARDLKARTEQDEGGAGP